MGETKFPVPIKGPACSTTWEISELLLNYSHEAMCQFYTVLCNSYFKGKCTQIKILHSQSQLK